MRQIGCPSPHSWASAREKMGVYSPQGKSSTLVAAKSSLLLLVSKDDEGPS